MNKYKLIAMLLAPYKGGYQDEETIKMYNAIEQMIEQGHEGIAIGLLLNYPVDSDNITHFDCKKPYVLDADLDGVYLYKKL